MHNLFIATPSVFIKKTNLTDHYNHDPNFSETNKLETKVFLFL